MELLPQIFGIEAALAHASQSVDNDGLVFLIGDTVPLVGTGQDTNSCLAFVQQLADNGGQEVFALQRIGLDGIVQESGETNPCFVQVAPSSSV